MGGVAMQEERLREERKKPMPEKEYQDGHGIHLVDIIVVLRFAISADKGIFHLNAGEHR